jgi:phosphate transport system substrate-binding protein
MLRLRKTTASIAVTAAAALAAGLAPTLVASTALADPINSTGKTVTPQSYDVVGVGSNTDEYLFDQLSLDYNATVKTHNANHPYFYSWDATPPSNPNDAATTYITPKAGCSSTTVRPNGSGAGLTALDENTFDGKTGHYCIDYARTSSGRSSKAPKEGPGGVIYVPAAEDAVTWAVRDTGAAKGQPETYAPKSLTLAQLTGIFDCKYTNWDQVGGKAGKIDVYIPQSNSGTLSFWLKALGLSAAGSCAADTYKSGKTTVLIEENQGESAVFDSPNAVFIYSVADWIAQKYHSAAAGKKPTSSQNRFGIDDVGYLGVQDVKAGSTVYSPVTTAKVPTINASFKATTLTRIIYDILRWTDETPDHILARLEPFFAAKTAKVKGYVCANPTATKAIEDYGFLTTSQCGLGV